MNTIQKLRELLEETELNEIIGVDFCDNIWIEYEDEISYNTGDDVEDLRNGDGSTYSLEVVHNSKLIVDNYLVALVENGCGDQYTIVLDRSKEVLQ